MDIATSVVRECIVCFETMQQNYIRCRSRSCTTIMCRECMKFYIDLSLTEKSIPKCPTCSRCYIYSDVMNFPDLIPLYNKCCLNELINKHGDNARKDVEIKNKLELLRTQRQVFINQRFPKAIYYTAALIMPSKLRRLDKQITTKVTNQSKNSKRICINLTCTGSLDSNFSCLSCGTNFCMNCERRKDNNHICNPLDIESIKAVRNIVRCPSCNLPIIKGEGCDNMTCANCGQFFLYNTGEKVVMVVTLHK